MGIKSEDSSPHLNAASSTASTGRPSVAPKFDKTGCSSCGGEFGPGDHGFSHCWHHSLPRAIERIHQLETELAEARHDQD